ncbi:MAG TPA: ABC transporter substrate-binding protein, partial [Firmicutes bacterium]|nr:ABC transporter substrate-binding protein [Bacillota bacterium]
MGLRKTGIALIAILLLAVNVASAELPPNPKMENPVLFQEIGQYGGDLILAVAAAPRGGAIVDEATSFVGPYLRDPLVDNNPITNELEPGLAESWEISDDGTQVIFHLRKVKWSDGVPFTADDVIFHFDHVDMDPNNPGNQISRYTIGGKQITWEKIDDYTVRANLPTPYGAFLRVLTHSRIVPKHKLMEFAPAYNPDAEPGSISRQGWNPDKPASDMVGTGTFRVASFNEQQIVLERNPYSWRVDPEGNQLPYVDRVISLVVPNTQVQQAKFLAGEVDYLPIAPSMYPNLKREEVAGAPFKVFRGAPVNPTPSPPHWSFNFDVEDAELREVFQNVRFREAMAKAVNYERILDQVYNTLAILSGMPVLPSNAAFYNPEIDQYRHSHDLEKTAAILDELGIIDRNGDGFRDYPSGKTFEFTLTAAVNVEAHNDIAAMLQNDLESIGVKVHLQLQDSRLVADRALAGDFES